MIDFHKRNMETLQIAHILTASAQTVVDAIDRKLADSEETDLVLVRTESLRDIRLLVTTQSEAIAKLVENDMQVADALQAINDKLKKS